MIDSKSKLNSGSRAAPESSDETNSTNTSNTSGDVESGAVVVSTSFGLDIQNNQNGAEQWDSRISFVLAAIGAAVGLGNFWRFPFRVFEWGGVFLVPYFLIIFVIGLPLLQLELALGQAFQASMLGASLKMNPRMAGVGPAAAFLCFVLLSFYAAVIGWGCVYFVRSWETPLPWDVSDVTNASDYITIPGAVFDNLQNQSPDPSKTSTISSSLFAAVLFVYLCVFLILWKGAKIVGKAVWFTVLGPCVLLLFLVIWGATLDGADIGVQEYIGKWDWSVLSNGLIWQQAFTQVFFSLSIGTGALPVYGSYNKHNNNVIQDGVFIALFDAFFGFFSGFAVFTVAGFYSKQTGIPFYCDRIADETCQQLKDELGGPALVFNVYPAALSLIEGYGGNILCVILFLVFFLLGIDSAFSLCEAPLTILREFRPFNKLSRTTSLVALLCGLFLLSCLFISDIGGNWAAVQSIVNEDMGLLWITYLEVILVCWMVNRKEVSDVVGSASHITFDLSCLVAAVLFSCMALSETNWGITIGISFGFLILGVVSAIVLAQQHGSSSIQRTLYALCLQGPQALFDEINSKIQEDRPKNWSFGTLFLINAKFFVTAILTYMLCSAYNIILVVDGISVAVCGGTEACDIAPAQYYVGAFVIFSGLVFPWVAGIFNQSLYENK